MLKESKRELSASPLICALDTADCAKAVDLAKRLQRDIGAVKLGLEFFTAHGAEGVKRVAACGVPVFLDLKFHDIPNTVHKAVLATERLGAFMLTVHASGGLAMMRAAKDAADQIMQNTGNRPNIIGVTVLTSLDAADLQGVGVAANPADQALRLAQLAQKAGLDGVVCSAHEITRVRAECGEGFTLVVPGIRPAGADAGDQKRTLTPQEALKLGADYLVIGRPITQSPDPVQTAREIAALLKKQGASA